MNILHKSIGNLLIALLAPIMFKITWIPAVLDAVIYNNYKYYDFEIDSLGTFLKHVYLETFVYEYLFAIIAIFLPFQLLKDYNSKKKSSLSFFKKVLILASITALSIIIGSFSNIWEIPWYKNLRYLLFSLISGLIFTPILYLAIDRYIEKRVNS